MSYGFLAEVPFSSPHPRAKLYQNFIFKSEDDAEKQLANFATYKTLKWAFEEKTTKGHFQPISGLVLRNDTTRICTNSLEKIETGDILLLNHPALGGNKYFIVDGNIEIDGDYGAKWRQTFQHLPLKLLDIKKINIKR